MAELRVFEDAGWRSLAPLTYWRATFDLRCGADSLLDKIEGVTGARASLVVRPELAPVLAERQTRPVNAGGRNDLLLINGRVLLRAGLGLAPRSAIWAGETLVAAHITADLAGSMTADVLLDPARTRQALGGLASTVVTADAYSVIEQPWQLVELNASELRQQMAGGGGRNTGRIDPRAVLINEGEVRVGNDAMVKAGVVLDAENGPIRIDQGAVISHNAVLQGPCFVGTHAVVQPNSVIREATSIGPWCKVGGELEGTILHGYSNKQHYGFLGHSYVGEWVNLGAGTVNSDLKNTYGTVRVPINGQPVETGRMFVGAFVGDHAKTGINVALPTGCVIGFAANVLTSRQPPRFVPSFAWLTDAEEGTYDPLRALAVARKVMARRQVTMSPAEEQLFLQIADSARRLEYAASE
jgi:UDP-N-acetylglucosamine diphosphorylase/glucosamine-1-phosphate N-acetyltransferase